MVCSVRSLLTPCIAVVALSVGMAEAKYKARPLPLRSALEYVAHQDFQKVVIGAFPATTAEDTERLFDTDKVYEKRFLPVLLIIENNNDFPIRIDGSDVYLTEGDGSKQAPVSFLDVLLKIGKEKPRSNYSSKEELVRKAVKREVFEDFQGKAFLQRTIEPGQSGHGVVFFKVPYGGMEGATLYFPEVINVRDQEALIFFEFELFPQPD